MGTDDLIQCSHSLFFLYQAIAISIKGGGGRLFSTFYFSFLEDEASVLPQVVFFLLFLTDKDEIILLKLANRFHEKIRVLFASNIFVIFILP